MFVHSNPISVVCIGLDLHKTDLVAELGSILLSNLFTMIIVRKKYERMELK